VRAFTNQEMVQVRADRRGILAATHRDHEDAAPLAHPASQDHRMTSGSSFQRLRHRMEQARRRRTTGRPHVAFVLSGGGNHGVAQVGMLKALLEHGIVPDVLIGTSVGALNAAAVAAEPTLAAVHRLERIWQGLKAEELFPGGAWARTWKVVRKQTHLVPNTGLVRLVERFAAGSFHDLTVPLRVVATDVATGEETVFAAGPLAPALLASTALPGLLPAVEHDGRLHIDGAVVNNVPLAHAFAAAGTPTRVYVLDVSGSFDGRTPRHPGDVLLHAFAIARKQRYQVERAFVPPGMEVIELPRPADSRSIFDFSGNDAIRHEAYVLADRFLHARAAAPPLERPRVVAVNPVRLLQRRSRASGGA
jgi:NTE family protein